MTRKKAVIAKEGAPSWFVQENDEIGKVLEVFRKSLEELVNSSECSIKLFEDVIKSFERPLALVQSIAEEIADGRWARSMVVTAAERALFENRADEELCKDLGSIRDEFLASFAVIAADVKIEKSSRAAISEAIARALWIGLASESPDLVRRLEKQFKQAKAAAMRGARAEKSAPKKDAALDAVRAAMNETATKATRGEAYARIIQPGVEKRLKRKVSVPTVCRYVRVILEE